ncbi:hypothetical protein ACIBK9_10620 [Nonomuraea sp. NPDC050227]|uniref:hypothetical protein n=1 Tax=Nonomuraea sp. NPDC050227 TaxID=3364360 RepID=UPI0037BCBE8A
MAISEQHRPEIVVGLVATPPDYPAQVVARLAAELADRLAEQVDPHVRWTVRAGWGDVAPRRDGGVEALLDDLARRRADARWDVAICLTDLPLHTERVPLVAQTSARRRVAAVSLPALGLCQLRALRAAIPGLVSRLLTDTSEDRETSAELARLFNLGTVLTLTLAAAVSYLVLFAGTTLVAALLIDTSVLARNLQRPVDLTDYLKLAWIISSLATVGGTIGSGLEDEDTVRAAAYGYHPEPGGWRDERDA